ncbi:MAG TPA: hypothetical protein VES42_03135 [Pilimelia sp.]|nr:hypothetical protein [Pilimelia sp.]
MSAAPRDPAGSAAAGGPGPARYLLGSDDDELLTAVVASLPAGARLLGRPAAGLVTVEAAAPVAADLAARYAGRLVVEPDAALDPLPPVGPGTTG